MTSSHLVIEVKVVLNSRPLSYVNSEDIEEPLTPSHLLIGFCLLTLPDPSVPQDDPDLLKFLHREWFILPNVSKNSGNDGKGNT